MTLYLKGNEIFEVFLELCRLYQLITPIVGLERFNDFDMWVVTINNDERAKSIIDYLTVNRYSYNILKIEEKKEES